MVRVRPGDGAPVPRPAVLRLREEPRGDFQRAVVGGAEGEHGTPHGGEREKETGDDLAAIREPVGAARATQLL